MAAMRSALAILARRSCGSVSSAAAPMGRGRGLEMYQIYRSAPPPLRPSLRPLTRNLELPGLQRFSSVADRAGQKNRWWQRAGDSIKNYHVFGAIGYVALVCYLAVIFRAMQGSGTNSSTGTEFIRSSSFPMSPFYRYATNATTLHTRNGWTKKKKRSSILRQA